MNGPEFKNNIESGTLNRPDGASKAEAQRLSNFMTGQQKTDLPREVTQERTERNAQEVDALLNKYASEPYLDIQAGLQGMLDGIK